MLALKHYNVYFSLWNMICITKRGPSISFLNGPTPASFSFIFGLFKQTKNTMFTIKNAPSILNGPTLASFSFIFGLFKQTIQFYN